MNQVGATVVLAVVGSLAEIVAADAGDCEGNEAAGMMAVLFLAGIAVEDPFEDRYLAAASWYAVAAAVAEEADLD
jgi:hypothetical protein